MLLPDPRGLEWQEWADTVVGYNPVLRNRIDPDDPWEEFAESFCQYVQNAPVPRFFDTWQAWVSAVISALKG